MGKLLILIGIIIVLVGLVIEYTPNIPIGKLPGDIRIERENFRFYFPITTSVLLSVLLALGIYLLNRLKE